MKPRILFITTVLTFTAIVAPTMSAKEKKSTSSSPSAATSLEAGNPTKKTRALPYHGKVASVDASSRTFTIGKRTFAVTNDTKITRDGATAASNDIVSGEMVGGSYWRKDDGTLELKTVKISTKSTAASEPATDSPKQAEKKK
jgi:hypothetical protein